MLNLAYDQAVRETHGDTANDLINSILITSTVLNSWLFFDSILKMSGFLIRIKVEKAFNRDMTSEQILRGMGILDLLLNMLCLSYGISEVGLWIQIARLAVLTQAVLDLFPHIGILMSGIGNGFKSVMYTILLLFLLVCSYAVLGFHLFKSNDPFHFGTIGLSALTFFQLTTFESWGTIFNINYGGCDSYPSEYSSPPANISSSGNLVTDYGIFRYPLCENPSKHNIAAVLIFCSYTIFAGYVIVNMSLAAVAIGINERLEELRNLQLFGTDEPIDERESNKFEIDHTLQSPASNNAKTEAKKRKQLFDGKAAKLTGGNIVGRKIKENLQKVWMTMRKGSKHKFFAGDESFGKRQKITLQNISMEKLSKEARFLIKEQRYQLSVTLVIFAAAILQFYNDTESDTSETNAVHLFFQLCFVLDSCVRFLCHYEKPMEFFRSDLWNSFDVAVTIILFVPTGAPDSAELQFLEFLRIFRMARILQIGSVYAMDLHVILSAISSSFVCLIYVMAILFLFFAYFSLIGVLLFKEANPFFFSTFGNSLRALLQVMTLDNWSDLMRYCMLGCAVYQYPVEMLQSCSTDGKGVGWFAPLFFVSFIIVASFVLSSLLVGVIITSMELLREGIKEEEDIWAKVNRIMKRYKTDQQTIDLLLELFEGADSKKEGIVTYEALETMVGSVGIEEAEVFAYYVRVDQDKNGQLDFSEFCEFILLIGGPFNEKKDEEERLKREEKKQRDAIIHNQKLKPPKDVLDRKVEMMRPSLIGSMLGSSLSSIKSVGDSLRSASSKNTHTIRTSTRQEPPQAQSAAANSTETATITSTASSSTTAQLVLEEFDHLPVIDDHGPAESKEDCHPGSFDTRIKVPPEVRPPAAMSPSFLSRVAKVYLGGNDDLEHEGFYQHGV